MPNSEAMTHWLKDNAQNLWWLAGFLGIAIIVFAVGRGTGFQQFGLGLLCAVVALFVALAIFEALWQATARLLKLDV